MIINNQKQFEIYKKKSEFLLKQICQYENEHEIPNDIINEYKQISDAIIEYESAYHPLPGRVSTLITDEIEKCMVEKNLKQKNVAKMLGVSESRISDLLKGKRPLNLRIAKRLRDELGIPADFILNHC
jgi:antitoxin component HigA of HigAB toxin-antitoxin module